VIKGKGKKGESRERKVVIIRVGRWQLQKRTSVIIETMA